MTDDLVERLRNKYASVQDAIEGAERIEELEAALRKIAKHDTQAIALNALERGSQTSQMRRKTNE